MIRKSGAGRGPRQVSNPIGVLLGENVMLWRRMAAAAVCLAAFVSLIPSAFAGKPNIRNGESITAVLSGAPATTQPTFAIDYADLNTESNKSAAGSLTGATPKTLLSATSSPLTVQSIGICNIDTAAVTVTIKRVAADTTATTLAVVILQANDLLTFSESGVSVTDSSGQVKSGTGTAVTPTSIPAHEWRKTDGVTVNAATAASTNFGVVYGTDGTDFPHLETIDSKNATTAVVSRVIVKLPANYVAGSAITIRARCGMKTTVASNSGSTTIDFSAYSNSGVANAGSADLVTTNAQSINSLTAANYDFTVTPTGLVAGQDLHIKMTLTVTDSATGTAVIGTVNHCEILTTTYR